MKRTMFTGILAVMIVCTMPANGQKLSKKEKTVLQAIEAIKTESGYAEAERLAKEANLKMLAGEVKVADSLIRKSIERYPVLAVLDYARTMARMPDIAGANVIMSKVADRVQTFPEKEILMLDPHGFFLDSVKTITKCEKSRAYFNFLLRIYEVNRAFGDRKSIIKSIRDMRTVKLAEQPEKGATVFDFEVVMQQNYKINGLIFERDFSAAQTLLDATPVTIYFPEEVRKHFQLSIYIAQEEYLKAIEIAESFKAKKEGLTMANFSLFLIYAKKGDAKALEYYDQDSEMLKGNNATNYLLALVDLGKKDYGGALKNLKLSLSLRSKKVVMADMLIESWDFYKAYGDAYAGLKDYVKARDNYNIALLYYPENKSVLNALTRLEVQAAEGTSTDKTGPVIAINEPMPNRGLKVTAIGENVMVKGIATDPSGIKEVRINGKIVYAQESGNFWADVPMVNGINKITVMATDMAGNKAENTFEIEKSAAPVAVANDVIAVAEKEGKNYCLLLAAQNYADSNIPSLENPIADAVKLKLILKNNYNFTESNIITLFNPATADLKRQLLELTNTLQPEDNLLIFYAGHGIWVEKEKKGYWLLTDSKYKDVNTWLPNKEVLDLIARLPSRHTLLITDACFSGSVFKTRGLKPGAPGAIREMDNKISRVAITSGNDTEVPDESVFMKYLVKALSENKDQYLSAQKMFINQILEAVMTESKTEPRYGTLELAGHVGGDFIFTKK